jgi:hypothetical protein
VMIHARVRHTGSPPMPSRGEHKPHRSRLATCPSQECVEVASF